MKITFFAYILGLNINFAKNTVCLSMKRFFLVIIIGSLICFNYSCKPINQQKQRGAIKGNRSYGGTIHVNETTPVLNLYPYYIYDNVSFTIASQIYDGLVKLNPKDLSVVPDIAKSWDIDASGTVYTFHLHSNVVFHDDPCFSDGKGRKVVAGDFKYSMEKLCTASEDNVVFSITFKDMVEGANEYYEKSKKGPPPSGISGIKVVNDSTLEIKLLKKDPVFLAMIAGTGGFVIAREATEKYGNGLHVGTGPFIYSYGDSSKIILTENPNYFRFDSLGNRLPYVDSIVFTFMANREQEFKLFSEGKLDYITSVPSDQVYKLVEEKTSDFLHKPPRYILSRIAEMSTKFYAFNINKAPFNDIRVRKAFSLAIDRNKIVSEVLQGQAFAPGLHGVTPPTFMGSSNPGDNYDISTIIGDSLNVPKAEKLLTEAGFPDGKGFPDVTLELDDGGGINTGVAMEMQKELKANLKVNVNLNIATFSQKLEDEKFMKFDMVFMGWNADYPAPEDFLMLFLGSNVPDSAGQPSYYNSTRYKNPEYDKLFELGRTANTTKESYTYYKQAEQLAINDAPIMVMWYDQNYSLTRGAVKGLYSNSINYIDLSCVYIDEKSAKAADEADKADSIKKK